MINGGDKRHLLCIIVHNIQDSLLSGWIGNYYYCETRLIKLIDKRKQGIVTSEQDIVTKVAECCHKGSRILSQR